MKIIVTLRNMEKAMQKHSRKLADRERAKHKKAVRKFAARLDAGVYANSRGFV